jgi:hypothetical protein
MNAAPPRSRADERGPSAFAGSHTPAPRVTTSSFCSSASKRPQPSPAGALQGAHGVLIALPGQTLGTLHASIADPSVSFLRVNIERRPEDGESAMRSRTRPNIRAREWGCPRTLQPGVAAMMPATRARIEQGRAKEPNPRSSSAHSRQVPLPLPPASHRAGCTGGMPSCGSTHPVG